MRRAQTDHGLFAVCFICLLVLLVAGLTGCESVPTVQPAIRIANVGPSTFCRHMTVVDEAGQKQCRLTYESKDTPTTANGIEDVCARWEASCKGKGK